MQYDPRASTSLGLWWCAHQVKQGFCHLRQAASLVLGFAVRAKKASLALMEAEAEERMQDNKYYACRAPKFFCNQRM
jgi:hypothetical protein